MAACHMVVAGAGFAQNAGVFSRTPAAGCKKTVNFREPCRQRVPNAPVAAMLPAEGSERGRPDRENP